MINQIKNIKISVIGQGYVGLPMSIVLATKCKNYKILGIEKNNSRGNYLKELINNKLLPFDTNDNKLKKKFIEAINNRKYSVSTNLSEIKDSNIIIVSINADFKNSNTIKNIQNLFKSISNFMNKNTLIFLESTLPPGTCNKYILPILLKKIKKSEIKFCYSYERVTPGRNYYDSIINSYRCYSGANDISKLSGKKFLKSFVNYKKYKLVELPSIIDCETAKILENSFRAINIAFIDEWTKFSNKLNINLNSIINAISLRKTHSNIMRPGVGVGGYCLTKDPGFANISSKKIFKLKNEFPITNLSKKINYKMVKTSLEFIESKTSLKNKKILVLGATYKEDVGDFRYSPSLELIKKLGIITSKIDVYDPYLTIKNNFKLNSVKIEQNKLFFKKYDCLILTVKHPEFEKINFRKNLSKKTKVFDLCGFFKSKKNMSNLFILGGR